MIHIYNIEKSIIYSCIFVVLCIIVSSCNSKQSGIEKDSYLHEIDSIKEIIQNKRDSIRIIEGDRAIGDIYWNMPYKDFVLAFEDLCKNHKNIGSFEIEYNYSPRDIIHIEETPIEKIPISIWNKAVFYKDSLVLLSLWHNEPINNFRKQSYQLEKILNDIVELYSWKYGEPDFYEKDVKWEFLDRYINLDGTKAHHIAEWGMSYKFINLFVVTGNGFSACPVLQFYYKSKIDSINKVIDERIICIENQKRNKEMIQDSINKDNAKSII